MGRGCGHSAPPRKTQQTPGKRLHQHTAVPTPRAPLCGARPRLAAHEGPALTFGAHGVIEKVFIFQQLQGQGDVV